MAYTNSSLVNYTKLSPNNSGQRTHTIDTITIHCVVGQASVETLGNIFAPTTRQASCQYGIGYDGRIGMYCEEKNRSWCSSSASNDQRAITIEVASDTTAPYAVNEKAYASLLNLVTDVCKRNNIKQLLWKGDKSLIGQVDKQNMTVHRWFASRSCPGDYLYNRHGEIATEVNKRLNPNTDALILKLKTENASLTSSIATLTKEKTALAKSIEDLNIAKAIVEGNLVKKSTEYNVLLSAHNKTVEDLRIASESLAIKTIAVEDLQSRVNALDLEDDSLSAEILTLSVEIEVLKKQLSEKDVVVSNIQASLTQTESELKRCREGFSSMTLGEFFKTVFAIITKK
jgi:hypothetical protein